jgi:hypothetical protein
MFKQQDAFAFFRNRDRSAVTGLHADFPSLASYASADYMRSQVRFEETGVLHNKMYSSTTVYREVAVFLSVESVTRYQYVYCLFLGADVMRDLPSA